MQLNPLFFTHGDKKHFVGDWMGKNLLFIEFLYVVIMAGDRKEWMKLFSGK